MSLTGKDRFVPLHNHTEFSLLDGGAKIEEILRHAKAMGQDAIAFTDHGNMYGAVKANKLAKEIGIKHIVGCELYITPWGRLASDKDYKKGEKPSGHLIALAKNPEGYKNLCRLSSRAWVEGFYRRPRIDREMLKQHSGGLIVTSACIAGSICQSVMNGDIKKAEEEIEFMADLFKDDFYIEIQDHKIPEEALVMDYMRRLAKQFKISTVIGTDAHYLLKDDDQVHDALICIGTGQKVDGERRFQFNGTGYHYMSEQEVKELFPNDLEAIYNSGRIADKIEGDVIETGHLKIPFFNIPKNKEFDNWKGENRWWL